MAESVRVEEAGACDRRELRIGVVRVLEGIVGERTEALEGRPGLGPAAHGVGVGLLPSRDADGGLGAERKEQREKNGVLLANLIGHEDMVVQPAQDGKRGTRFPKELLEVKQAGRCELLPGEEIDAVGEELHLRGKMSRAEDGGDAGADREIDGSLHEEAEEK